MTEDMTMTLIYILPFSGRVDQRLQSIVAPPWSGAQQKAYIIRDSLSSKFHMQLIPSPWDELVE